MSGNNSREAVRPIALTVRLSALIHELAIEEARLEGASLNQFIREAVLVRCIWRRGQRGEVLMPGDDLDTFRKVVDGLQKAIEYAERQRR